MDKKNIIFYGLEVEQTRVEDKPVEVAMMGVSVACAHEQGQYLFYDRESDYALGTLASHLTKADLVVGFNNLGRDKKVLAGVGATYESRQEIDLFQMILEAWWQLEIPPDTEKWPTNYPEKAEFYEAWDLDSVLEGTLGIKKDDDITDLCAAWEKGKVADVVNACREKVMRTKRLFKHITVHHWVKNSRENRVELDKEVWEELYGWSAQDVKEQAEGVPHATKLPPSKPIIKATHWHNLLRAKVVIVGQQGNCVLFRQDLGGGKLGSKVEGKWDNLIPIEQPGGPARHIKTMEPFPLRLQDDEK